MKIEFNEEVQNTASIIAICIAVVTIAIVAITYYHHKAELLSDMVKSGQDPIAVRCALYVSCPSTPAFTLRQP